MKKQPSIRPIEDFYNTRHPFKTLFRLYDGLRIKLCLGIFFFILKSSPVWIQPIIFAQVINIVSQPHQHALRELWLWVGLLGALYLQNVPTHVTHVYFMRSAIRTMSQSLRFAIVRRIQQLSIAFHDDFRSGRLQSKILRDVEAIEGLSENLVSNILSAIIAIVFALTVTLHKDPLIALFFVLTIPVGVILIRIFRLQVIMRNNLFRTEIERMTTSVAEMVEMMPVTRAHGLENVAVQRMEKQFDQVKQHGFKLDIINAYFASSGWCVFRGFELLCLLVTGYLAFNGRMPIGDVVMYQGFFGMIMGSVITLINLFPEVTRGFESIRSVGEVLESPDVERNEGKRPVPAVAGAFVFESVEFLYHQAHAPAISNFSLDVKAGECIAFVGASGAGKSTLVNLLIGFRRPTSGRILLDGIDMETLDLRDFRHHLAVVPQNTILFSGTIRENITYGIGTVSEAKIAEAITMANAVEFIRELPQGLDTPIGEHGGKLSGGQRQRIAIARALIRDPRIILLDEATSALDVASEALIKEAMERLAAGRTTFIVAHRLSTIRNANRIVVLKKGQIAEIGTHEELLSQKGEFFRLKNLQT